MAETFRLDQGLWRAHRNRLLSGDLLAVGIALAILQLFRWAGGEKSYSDIWAGFAGAALVFWITIMRQKRFWQTFELTIADNAITRRAAGYSDIAIDRNDITSVMRTPNGWIVIAGNSKRRLFVPLAIKNAADVERVLSEYGKISRQRRPRDVLERLAKSLPTASLLLMLIYGVAFAFNHWIASASTLAMAAMLPVWFFSIWRNPQASLYDRRAAWLAWIALPLHLARLWTILPGRPAPVGREGGRPNAVIRHR